MVNMYDRVFRKWKEFVLCKKELLYFFVNFMYVVVYLQYVLEFIRLSVFVDIVFYSIKWVYELVGFVFFMDNFLVNRVWDVVKRILGIKRGNRKEFFFVEIFKDIIDGFDLFNIF